jgi:hypothetical protein
MYVYTEYTYIYTYVIRYFFEAARQTALSASRSSRTAGEGGSREGRGEEVGGRERRGEERGRGGEGEGTRGRGEEVVQREGSGDDGGTHIQRGFSVVRPPGGGGGEGWGECSRWNERCAYWNATFETIAISLSESDSDGPVALSVI